ncbi:DUF3558 family protein [Kibdelosporangium philippinense]
MGITTLLLLAACSEPPQADRTTATPTPTRIRPGIPTIPPPIPRPLDASKFRDRPCDLFTDEQAAALGYPLEKRPGVVPEESYCVRDSLADVTVDYSIWYRHDGTDLFALAHRRETGEWIGDASVSITVEGQPAIKRPGAEHCAVLIGLSTTESIKIYFQDKKVDFCDRAVRIAEDVVRNVRG